MDALELLTSRRSEKKLTAPAPNQAQLARLFEAALHAPDHGKLNPYRFIVIENEGLRKLEALLKSAVIELNLDEKRLQKAEKITRQAPMIIGVVADLDSQSNVPAWEQMLSAGCATYSIQLAANAMGFDNVWVTAPWIEGSELRAAFGCAPEDKVIALLLIGSSEDKVPREAKPLDISPFVSYLS